MDREFHADFQRRAVETGRQFDAESRALLNDLGFRLRPALHLAHVGVRIDAVGGNRRGRDIFFQFIGGSVPPRPGLMRTDSAKKAICDAFLATLCGCYPVVLITSAKPAIGSGSDRMIRAAGCVIHDVFCTNEPSDIRRLRHLLTVGEFYAPSIHTLDPASLTTDTDHEVIDPIQPTLKDLPLIAPVSPDLRRRSPRRKREKRPGKGGGGQRS